jgi:homoserine dehydrogenase
MKKTIRLGLVGYGTVGQGVVEILEENWRSIEQRIGVPVEIAAVCDLHPVTLKNVDYLSDYNELLERQDIDIIVELIGGYEPARTLILKAVAAGKHIVTANKAVLAKYWDELFSAARDNNRLVYFEASVGGAIPVIQGLNEGMAANRIESINGILNGTTNYILSEMTRQGAGYAKALKAAQKAGFAEADPTFDVEGIDTANKLAILSSLAWSSWVKVDDIDVAGITNVSADDVFFAKKFGYVVKLIGSAIMTKEGLALSVQPSLVPTNHSFTNVEREYNAVLIRGDASGDIMFYGKGAGSLPAASAVVSDIIDLSRQVASGTAGRVPYITYDPSKKLKMLPKEKIQSSYYLRFTVNDRPGVLAKISGILGDHKVSIASVFQQEPLTRARAGVPIIILTHRTLQGNLTAALKQIDRLAFSKQKAVKMKIEVN